MRIRTLASLALLTAIVAGTALAAGKKMSYVYKRGDHSYSRISGDLDNIRKLSNRYGSEFVWISLDRREYVVRDAATLAAVRETFRDVDALHPSMQAIEARMRPYERRIQQLENQLDPLSDSLDDDNLTDRTRDAIEEKMRVLERAMRDVEEQMEGVEREMERMEKEIERREEIAEKRFEALVDKAIASGAAQRVD